MLSTIQFKNTRTALSSYSEKDTRVLHVGLRVFEPFVLCAVRTSKEKGLNTEHQEHSVIGGIPRTTNRTKYEVIVLHTREPINHASLVLNGSLFLLLV